MYMNKLKNKKNLLNNLDELLDKNNIKNNDLNLNNYENNKEILDAEKLFAILLNTCINANKANYIIQKSQYKYCYIDFILLNINNLHTTYIEYKERTYKTGFKSYPSYFISLRKYNAIKKYYKNSYIIFDFTHQTKDEDEFYYIKYDEKLFKTFNKDLEYNRLEIPNHICSKKFTNLVNELLQTTNLNLL